MKNELEQSRKTLANAKLILVSSFCEDTDGIMHLYTEGEGTLYFKKESCPEMIGEDLKLIRGGKFNNLVAEKEFFKILPRYISHTDVVKKIIKDGYKVKEEIRKGETSISEKSRYSRSSGSWVSNREVKTGEYFYMQRAYDTKITYFVSGGEVVYSYSQMKTYNCGLEIADQKPTAEELAEFETLCEERESAWSKKCFNASKIIRAVELYKSFFNTKQSVKENDLSKLMNKFNK